MSVLIHQAILKFDPQILLWILVHLQKPLFPVRLLDQHLNVCVLHQELVVEDILDLGIIDGQKLVSRRNLQFLGNTSWQDLCNPVYPVCYLHVLFLPLLYVTCSLSFSLIPGTIL